MNRTLATIISFLGHPLLILTYVLLILMAVNPFAFGVSDMADPKAVVLALSVFGATFIIPGFGVALMKPLGLIKSLHMEDKQDRTGPYIICGVFYLWLFKNLLSNGHAPALYAKFVLGATIALFLAFFINIFTKISAHAAGMGGMVVMLLLTALNWQSASFAIPVFNGTLQLSLLALSAFVIVLAGLVGTARLALGAHEPADLYRGYGAGILAVLLANMMV